MHETPGELHRLQALLDTSLARSTAHLRSIIDSERALTAEQLTRVLTGMCTLALSTVTAKGGHDAFDWDNDVVYYRLHPHWMAAFAPDPARLG
ncbi:hypothetical protein ACIG5E_35450 [Kitasatospora sp. NPDC053057]|uniref:hypothetical protein n=1 Tax=Kitasatospora sp. NPDC053057 TaxID=3364062 RepID=UPI0037C8F0E5